MKRDHSFGDLLEAYRQHRLSRRQLLGQAAALGLSASAVGALLTAERAAAAAPARQEEPQVGGTLREGYDLDFSKLDPVATTWYDPAFYALFESLIIDSPEGTLEPSLATAWEVSEDGMTATFTIREGALFHTGRPVTAGAVKEVYDAIKDPASASPLAILFAPVTGIEAPDDQTLILTMDHPYYEVLNVVKTGYWGIVNMETRTALGEAWAQSEVDGTGPFTFTEWVPGSHTTVTRWEDYPGSIVPFFQNKGKAYLDAIRWEAILEASQRAVRIENGEIDTVRNPALQDVSRLQGNPDLNVLAFSEPSGYILCPNFEREDLDFHDVRMRQAISHAIDRPAIVKALLFDFGDPLYGPITPADRFYDPNVEQLNQLDLDQARALVAELGWTPGDDGILTKNGTRMAFNLVVQSESFNRDLGSVVQAQLREIGMEVTVEALDRGSYFAALTEGADLSLFYYLWAVPMDIIILFISTATRGNPNWGRSSVPEVDEAVTAWQQAPNEEALVAAGNNLQMMVAEHLPVVPVVVRDNIWAQRSNVHGWLPHAYDIYPHYNDVWLDQ